MRPNEYNPFHRELSDEGKAAQKKRIDELKAGLPREVFAFSALLVLILLVVYLFSAVLVFQFRHPWMTNTERFLHLPQALQFETVPEEK